MMGKKGKKAEKSLPGPTAQAASRLPDQATELSPFRRRVEQVKRDVDFDLVIRRMQEIESQFEEFGHRPIEFLDDRPPN